MSDDPVRDWLVDEVIGFELCPFAAAPWRQGTVHLARSTASTVDAAIEAVAAELVALAELPESERSTTLLALPALEGWEALLDVVGATEQLLEDAGSEALFQVVGFHPDAVYEGAPPDDPANATARAPLPVVHLLRADMVERLVAQHPDPAGISEDNARRLRARAR